MPSAVDLNSAEMHCTYSRTSKHTSSLLENKEKKEENKCKIIASHLLRGGSVVIQISGISYEKKRGRNK